MITIATAIQSLVGDVEFTIIDGNLSDIQWNSEPSQVPTETEITAEYERLISVENNKRETLLSKLGITADEAALLLG
jgi:hypothetical protein